MFDSFLAWLILPGSLTTIMLVLIFSFIFGVFINAQFQGKLNWLDLVCRGKQRSVISLSKILQLVGGIVATWVVIKSTLLSEGNISWEIFTAYLAYVGSVEAYGKYITLKSGGLNPDLTEDDYPQMSVNYHKPGNPNDDSECIKEDVSQTSTKNPKTSAIKTRTIKNDISMLGGDTDIPQDEVRIGGAKAID